MPPPRPRPTLLPYTTLFRSRRLSRDIVQIDAFESKIAITFQPLDMAIDAVRDARATRSGIGDRKSTRLNSSHLVISYAVFCLKKKKYKEDHWTPRSAHESAR